MSMSPLTSTFKGPRISVSETITSGPVTLDGTIEVVNVDATSGAITVNLPQISTALGLPITVRKVDSSGNAVTVAAHSGENIQGSSTVTLSSQWSAVSVYNDGVRWYETAGASGGGGGTVTGTGAANALAIWVSSTAISNGNTVGGTGLYAINGSNGNSLGIGTSSQLPGAALGLQVFCSSAEQITAPQAVFMDAQGGVTGAYHHGHIAFGGSYSTTGSQYTTLADIGCAKENGTDGDPSGNMTFFTKNSGGTMTEYMRLTSIGRLLLGTTDDGSHLLQVKDGNTTSLPTQISVQSSSGLGSVGIAYKGGSGTWYSYASASNPPAWVLFNGSTNYFNVYPDGAGNPNFTITGGIAYPRRHVVSDANYTIASGSTDYTIAYSSITAPRTVTLQTGAGVGTGQVIIVKDESGSCSNTNTITITPASGTINGASTYVLNTAYAGVRLYSNGSQWFTEAIAVSSGGGGGVTGSGVANQLAVWTSSSAIGSFSKLQTTSGNAFGFTISGASALSALSYAQGGIFSEGPSNSIHTTFGVAALSAQFVAREGLGTSYDGVHYGGGITFGGSIDATTNVDFAAIVSGKENATTSNRAAFLAFGTTPSGAVGNAAITEVARFTSAGRLLVGTTTDSGFTAASFHGQVFVSDTDTAGITASTTATLEMKHSAAGASGGVLRLSNIGFSNASVALEMATYDPGNASYDVSSKIMAIDNGTFGNHITFWNKSTGTINGAITEKMRLSAAGNLLIGSTSDNGAALQVAGNSNSTGATVTGELSVSVTSTSIACVGISVPSGGIGWSASNNTDSTLVAKIIGSGQASIGTDFGGRWWTLESDNHVTVAAVKGGHLLINTTSDDSSGAVLQVNGGVQIGTNHQTAMQGQLWVTKNAGGSIGGEIWICNGGGSINGACRLAFSPDGSTDNTPNSSIQSILTNANGSSDMFFSNFNGSSIQEYMRIKSGGAVLMGTTTDDGSHLLQVHSASPILADSTDSGGSTATMTIQNNAGGNGNPFIAWVHNSGTMGSINGWNTSANFGNIPGINIVAASGQSIGFRVANTNYGSFASSGRFLINTQTDDSFGQLQLNGSLSFPSTSGGTIRSAVSDGATAVNLTENTLNTLANAAAKLSSYQNNGTEKAFIDKDGLFSKAIPHPIAAKRMGQYVTTSTSDTSFTADKLQSPLTSGTASAAPTADSTQMMILFQSSSTIGTTAGISGPYNSTRFDYRPRFGAVIRTGTNPFNFQRIYIGLTDGDLSGAANMAATNGNHYVAFRLDGGIGDTAWMAVSSDGTTASATSTGVNWAPNTTYILSIEFLTSGTCLFRINNATNPQVSKTTNLPTGATDVGIEASITTITVPSTNNLYIGKIALEQN